VDRSSPEEPYSLFLLSIDTAERKRLTFPPAQSPGDSAPRFSSDGKTVAFIRQNNTELNDLYLVPITGGDPKRLTFDNQKILGLDWVPDGREIIFSSDRVGVRTLWRIAASGGKPTLLAGVGENAALPTVSHHGNRLAYTQGFFEANIWRLDVMASDQKRGPPVKLIASTREDEGAQYSPDCRKIVFGSGRSGRDEIWICDSDGHNPVQLTFGSIQA
jgi:Tol biopolymer transport system component